jgi:hypothetical protein
VILSVVGIFRRGSCGDVDAVIPVQNFVGCMGRIVCLVVEDVACVTHEVPLLSVQWSDARIVGLAGEIAQG